jgi:DNA-binding GntR family transcriptional regulator
MLRLTENGAPLVRQTLVDSVYETLLDAMLSGKIASGTELNEVALARELGVSRTPVHEALAWLAADELVELSGSRARVRTMTAAEVADLYDVRQLLECSAVERAATHMTDPVLQQLRLEAQELGRSRTAPDWPERAIAFDVRFHDVVAEASGSARLRAEIRRYRLLVRAFCRITGGQLKNLQDSYQEHLTILRALEKRDPKAARKAMADHISRRVQIVLAEVYPAAPADAPTAVATR